MSDDYEKAASWLLENDIVSDPLILNGIIAQTMLRIRGVEDLEVVLDQNNKKILLWCKIDYSKKGFFKKKTSFEEEVQAQVSDIINSVLPRWKNRVVLDRDVFNKALKIVNGMA